MNVKELRAYCKMCVPENWRHEENVGVGEDKIRAGRALVARAQTPDALAIVAFANAMPELLDTIERLQKERDAWEEVAKERGESFAPSIEDFNNMRDQKDAALAEVERLKAENERLDGQLEGFMARQGEQMA